MNNFVERIEDFTSTLRSLLDASIIFPEFFQEFS